MTILSFSVFALSISSYVIDKDGSIVPYTTFVLFASMFSFVIGIKETQNASNLVKSYENSDSYNRAEQNTGDWNESNRLGKSLSLREDLYSWAIVTSFNSDYLAQIMFFKKREAEKK